MHGDDGVEVLFGHVPDGGVAHDPGIVHQDVEPAVGVDGLLDHGAGILEAGDVAVVGRGLAAALGDDVHGEVGVPTLTLAADRAAQIVDDDLGPLLGQLHGVTPADAVPGPGDDGDLAVEQSHCPLSSSGGF